MLSQNEIDLLLSNIQNDVLESENNQNFPKCIKDRWPAYKHRRRYMPICELGVLNRLKEECNLKQVLETTKQEIVKMEKVYSEIKEEINNSNKLKGE